jgi:transglutaminase-like putative cysteine protease
MRAFDRMGIATGLAIFLATFTITPLTLDSSFLGLSWVLILLIAGVSVLLRRARLGGGAVLATQLVILLGFTLALAASMPGEGEPAYDHLGYLWSSGVQHMQNQAAPMSPNDGVRLMFVTMIGLLMIMTDLLASGINRPVWALGPPATLFLVPAVGLGTDTGVFSFACVAIGYLAILVAEGLNSTARWTRGLSRDSAEGFGTATPVVWRAAGLIGIPALVGTVVLGLALPTLALPGFGLGTGSGGNGPLQLSDPTLDLRRNLTQPADVKVIEYQTEQPGGLYLRLASLPQFSAAGWTNVQMRLTSGETLGPIPGATGDPATLRTSTIKVLDLGSEYLPLPYAPRSFTAPGEWAYDPNSLVVLSTARVNRDSATRFLTYTVQSSEIAPDGDDLAEAAAGTPIDGGTTGAVPPDLPDSLIKLAERVTAGATSPAEKAAAIQAYLRGGTFTYSTEPLPGSGYQALENFLLKDHKGYCEQFAASMAMMARVVGIPSRVAVGFLPGERNGDTWEVTVHKMHAWPELYFAGFGWVRFEPTPASITGAAPSWTLQNDQPSSRPTDDPSLSTSASASAASEEPTALPSAEATSGTSGSGAGLGRTLITAALGLVALLILAAPATLRLRRRSGRLSPDVPVEERVESAWEEIRDSVVDYGGSWPAGSPRAIGNEIANRLEGQGSATMTQVATLVERSRYARSLGDEEPTRRLASMTQEIRKGLAAPQGRLRRVRALLLPKSLFRRP